jgi:hypothetical protein
VYHLLANRTRLGVLLGNICAVLTHSDVEAWKQPSVDVSIEAKNALMALYYLKCFFARQFFDF